MTWDAVVVGSGPGGLTAAVALAREGMRVLVLEQHYLPGGWTHSFNLEGYRFSPGIHYIGELGPGANLRHLLDGLGVGRRLEWNELNPDGFDHFQIGDARIDQPKGLSRWLARLKDRFPHEAKGLDKYFGIVERLVSDVRRCGELLTFPAALLAPFRAPTLTRWGFSTLKSLLDKTLTDPLLKAVLAAQCGNHGSAPSRVSLPVHAMMAAHYFDGGWYPKDGARAIPRAFIAELRAHQGQLRVRARVNRVIVERGRVAGVELEGGERIDTRRVICNADPALLYTSMLDERHCRRERRKVSAMEYSFSLASAFCAVDLDLEALGYDSGNYWWYRDTDLDRIYAATPTRRSADPLDVLFLTVTTLKDPGALPHGHHTLELFTFVPWEMFGGGERDEVYRARKAELGAQMVAAAEHVLPGISAHLKFFEVGTPLTNVHYCNSWRGAAYGTAKTPFQVGPFSFSQRGPVDGLYLCGASTLSHGFGGATSSGILAAQAVLPLTRFAWAPPVGVARPAAAAQVS